MRVAYFSPFPPKESGIALYSDQLVRHLRELTQVDCYDCFNEQAGDPSVTFGDFARYGRISDLGGYDAVIYHLGNHGSFHLDIFKTLRQWPGIVVVHDVVLYYMFAGLGHAGLLKYLWMVEARKRVDSTCEVVRLFAKDEVLPCAHPEEHPLTPAVFPYATRIIVHNAPASQCIVEMGYTGAIDVIPHLAFAATDTELTSQQLELLHRQHGIAEDEIVIGCFGFIGRTKRIAQACRALSTLKDRLKFRFLVVGTGEDITSLIDDAGLAKITIRTGFVEAAEFSRYLGLTDVLVNLRYPSMGESSGTLTRAMKLGKAAIVTRDAAFAELPDDAVRKIDLGPNEERDVAAAVEALARDRALRRQLGEAARRYAENALAPATIARQFERAIELDVQDRAHKTLLAEAASIRGSEVAAEMLRRSIERVVPQHIQKTALL